MGDRRSESIELLRSWQFPIDQQIAGFEEVAFFGELFDRIPTVSQDSSITVQIGDRAGGRSCVRVALVQGDVAGLLEQFRDVDRPIIFGANMHRHGEGFIANF